MLLFGKKKYVLPVQQYIHLNSLETAREPLCWTSFVALCVVLTLLRLNLWTV